MAWGWGWEVARESQPDGAMCTLPWFLLLKHKSFSFQGHSHASCVKISVDNFILINKEFVLNHQHLFSTGWSSDNVIHQILCRNGGVESTRSPSVWFLSPVFSDPLCAHGPRTSLLFSNDTMVNAAGG
jgi:hypothetical protein